MLRFRKAETAIYRFRRNGLVLNPAASKWLLNQAGYNLILLTQNDPGQGV
jgi:hypothetical protein